ncbi:hypothetical protein [Brumimicrobium oceani]|uniref:Uncharacterized protein n=1 Tax=Brumimicrobium oceani TaxID=2100725 RepID=A0A2U2XGD7_9FLAO|nr:hypothetical protein [Brumimicrobium oceani]PWH86862.1 hypothetical protein DIT68_00970 [Brumimicrobium oceani]
MAQQKINSYVIIVFMALTSFPIFGITKQQKETHKLLMEVNSNWRGLENKIEFTFKPNSEQELIQLHLFNVISYLESQSLNHLNENQLENRNSNIQSLKSYTEHGVFPINNLTNYRVPIFIDSKNTYCAVGFLMKESGAQKVAKEIAENQLLFYLENIKHSQLIPWQKASGLSLFELALIQPTYGPPTQVCATKSPVKWKNIAINDISKITKIVDHKIENVIYTVSASDENGLLHEINRYSLEKEKWERIGNQISGQILDLEFCENKAYISVFLPLEEFPHQILTLNNQQWEKVAHFNGNVNSIQSLHNKLYVLGDFNRVNSTKNTDFAIIEGNSVKSFYGAFQNSHRFDKMIASKTSLFLLSRGQIFQYKNDTLKAVNNIQYYSYLQHFTLSAVEDTLYVSSIHLPGYDKYFNSGRKSIPFENRIAKSPNSYGKIQFTKSKVMNGNMMISGAFSSATHKPQINDNTKLVDCNAPSSKHWYGEGLLYHYKDTFYPILAEGIVMDFVELNNKIYVLKKDGSLVYAKLENINEQISQLRNF